MCVATLPITAVSLNAPQCLTLYLCIIHLYGVSHSFTFPVDCTSPFQSSVSHGTSWRCATEECYIVAQFSGELQFLYHSSPSSILHGSSEAIDHFALFLSPLPRVGHITYVRPDESSQFLYSSIHTPPTRVILLKMAKGPNRVLCNQSPLLN